MSKIAPHLQSYSELSLCSNGMAALLDALKFPGWGQPERARVLFVNFSDGWPCWNLKSLVNNINV